MTTDVDARRRVVAWVLYDWAYAAFNTIVTTFVVATYFVQAVAPDPARGTTLWAVTQALAGLLIALAAAPLGAVADCGGRRRALLTVCTLVMVAATGLLWFVRPTAADVPRALLLVGTATVAYELATTLYNAMLPGLAPPSRMGRVSGIAWGMGYLGGLIALSVCLFGLITPDPPPFGLDRASAEPVRAAALLAAAWMLVFALPLLSLGEPATATRVSWGQAARGGIAGLRDAIRMVWADRVLTRFLLARMLYSDGLTTLFAFGAIYAAGTFGMNTRQVLMLGIGLNLTAGAGALLFALVEDRIGSRAVVLASLAALLGLGAAVLLVRDAAWFWAVALPLGLFIGPAQSASRCLMARLAPEGHRNAAFGLYALSGRITGFIGPASLALVTALTGSQRAGMAVILLLLGAGALLLLLGVRPARSTPDQTAIPARRARAIT